ncbi:MAG: DUF3320 domain-containing protein [Alphaproteobacteria bacterium]
MTKSETQSIEIKAAILERITFASHQNDVAVIADLSLRNTGEEILESLELHLTCEPALVAPRIWRIDRLNPNSELRLPDRSVPLAGAMLSDLTERMRADLRLTVQKDGAVLAEHHHTLTGLAHNEWGGSTHMPELLAAFIMPNDPATDRILSQAAETLRQAGEQPSLDGYQSKSRQRVWTQVSAIWSAISSLRLAYAAPPASFEREGQKIRTPSAILDGGVATCLDTAHLFAAALEQAGLNALVSFTRGHAFCGVWLQPQQLPALTTDDCAVLRTSVALSELVLFETTLVTREPPVPFSRAVEAADRQIRLENEGEFVYALDVKRTRLQQIQPLGARTQSADISDTDQGEHVVLGLEAAPHLPPFDLSVDDKPAEDAPESRLNLWKRKLLDLTLRNRLLNLRDSKTAIPLICPDPAKLEDKLANGTKIRVISAPQLSGNLGDRDGALFEQRTQEDFAERMAEDAFDRDEVFSNRSKEELAASLTDLYRKAKSDLQEGGANTLFLSIGILRWRQSADEERHHRAPLVLVPVTLERRTAASEVKIVRHEDETVFNKTLLELLRQDFEISLPQLEDDLPADESGVDIPLMWEILRKALRDVPGFEVTKEVVLSTFSFAKYLMWKDLADRTEDLKRCAFVQHLIDHPRDPYRNSASVLRPDETDEKIPTSELFMPLPADSSQIAGVHASAQSGDFILEGPPGTGKSQTIANIIAHNLGLGRRILFVSEKMAALEVVYRRLEDKGLGTFCLELHSNKANRRHVLDQLGKSWHAQKVTADENWQSKTRELQRLRNDLNALVNALHRPGPTGISAYAAIGRAARYGPCHPLRLAWKGGLEASPAQNREEYEELADAAAAAGSAFAEIEDADRHALQSITHTDWSMAWQRRLVEAAQNLQSVIERLAPVLDDFRRLTGLAHVGRTPSACAALTIFLESLETAQPQDVSALVGSDGELVANTLDAACKELVVFRRTKKTLSGPYNSDRLCQVPLTDFHRADDRVRSVFWPLSAIQKSTLTNRMQKAFKTRHKPNPSQDLPILEKLQQLHENLKTLTSRLPAGVSWQGLKTDIADVDQALAAAQTIRSATAEMAQTLEDLPALQSLVQKICHARATDGGTRISQSANQLRGCLADFADALQTFRSMASIGEISDASVLNDGEDDLDALHKKATQILDRQSRINAWCRWLDARKELERWQLACLVDALEAGLIAPDQAKENVQTAYAFWIAEQLIDDRTELQRFAALRHEDKIEAFRDIDQAVSDLSAEYVRARLSGEIPRPDAVHTPQEYGILARELRKKRGHQPIRKLINDMGNALTTLTPCLFMSPLSVAQYLSTNNQLFDLVIFDEASQITVWDAIGAIARGKNTIIVGDPKQMPPSNFFDRTPTDQDEESADLPDDMESILDEALAARVKLHRLTGHYRSRHESLIAFSNHRYYGGELVTYPTAQTQDMAVSFVQVDGQYQRGKGRTNPDEAKAVVREAVRRLTDPEHSKLSLGIITLNAEQQRLIDNLLDDERRKSPELEAFFGEGTDEPVFVKNLETVQGDQRDVILLSIGYGPDAPGATTMSMNFGPLNRKGGERRWNVAITRATSEVVVFASFNPSMIDLTRTSAAAVRDLKHYLEFAQRGPAALAEAIQHVGGTDTYDSDFEEAVAIALRDRGWIVHTQIGVSKFRVDLGIVDPDAPGRYLAGVECDGATYHRSPSARDRDRVRQAVLENLGWRLVRIWSTDFFIDPQSTLDRVHHQLTGILSNVREKRESESTRPDATNKLSRNQTDEADPQSVIHHPQGVEAEETDTDNAPVAPSSPQRTLFDDAPVSQPERVAKGQRAPAQSPSKVLNAQSKPSDEPASETLDPDRFYNDDYLPVLRKNAIRVIDDMGPVTFRHLCEMLARAHGFQRTGRQITSQVWKALPKTVQRTQAPDSNTILWPREQAPTAIMDFRGFHLGHTERVWADIPYPEKLGLAQAVLASGPHGDAASVMASKIGLSRLHQSTRQEFETLLADIPQMKSKTVEPGALGRPT